MRRFPLLKVCPLGVPRFRPNVQGEGFRPSLPPGRRVLAACSGPRSDSLPSSPGRSNDAECMGELRGVLRSIEHGGLHMTNESLYAAGAVRGDERDAEGESLQHHTQKPSHRDA